MRINTAGRHRGGKYPTTPSCVVLTQAQHEREKYPPLPPCLFSNAPPPPLPCTTPLGACGYCLEAFRLEALVRKTYK